MDGYFVNSNGIFVYIASGMVSELDGVEVEKINGKDYLFFTLILKWE